MLGFGSEISVAPHGGEAMVYRQRPVSRETVAVDSRRRSREAYQEVLGRQIVAMEPGTAHGEGVGSQSERVSRIEELIVYLEQKYKLTEE